MPALSYATKPGRSPLSCFAWFYCVCSRSTPLLDLSKLTLCVADLFTTSLSRVTAG